MPDVEEPKLYLQQNQPDGVPPLALTGERTLPDVPEENYWYRRHLVVYEWIRARVGGPARSSTWPAARATAPRCSRGGARRSWASTPTRRRTSTRRRATRRTEPPLRARPRRDVRRARRRRRVPADDRARPEPGRDPRALQDARRRVGVAGRDRLDAEPADARARGRREVRATRGTSRSTGRRSSSTLCRDHFGTVELYGLFHARRLRVHELAIKQLGWDSVHSRAQDHQAVLRPLHAGDLGRATSPCAPDRPLEGALDFVAVCRP